ncbi:MAG: DUF5719 family protein [Aeromicrobium sp.]|uniref:DUF5719 family protein n=1 Tax=Aeromicrobium sp. TaxID=1871063 RepID=UPI0039E3DB3C
MSRRRQKTTSMRLQTLSVLAIPALVVVLLVAGVLLGPAQPPDTAPRDIAVVSSVSACPTAGGLTASTGQVEAADSVSATATTGGENTRTDLDPSQWQASAATGDSVVIREEGKGGVAFAAGRLSSGGGLVVTECPRVSDETWYLGAGTSPRRPSALVLTNVADVPGSVDIQMWGPAGPIEAIKDDNVVVEPGQTTTIPVSEFAVGTDDVAIRVVRNRGAITAAFVDVSGSVLSGSEIVPSSGVPARETVLPGVAAAGTRTLLVANPGSSAATVTVHQSGTESDFVPEGLDSLQVPAGTVAVLPLPASSGTEATAFRVTSDVPVLPVVRVMSSDKDFAYATGGQAWSGPIVVPVATGAGAMRPVLQLLAESGTATVEMEAFDAAMTSVASTSVEVGSKVLTSVDLAATEAFGSPDIAYVVVTAKAPVHGTAVYRVENLIALMQLSEAPLSALGPHVQPGF